MNMLYCKDCDKQDCFGRTIGADGCNRPDQACTSELKVGIKPSPKHYTQTKYQPKDVIREWKLGFNLGSAIKYIARTGKKPGNSTLKDLRKAKQFLEFEITALEQEEQSNGI